MNEPILYVVLNKDLKMSAGKGAAQAVHAAMMLEGNYDRLFVSSYKRTVIVLQATTEQIRNLNDYLTQAGIYCDFYIDEGHNEVEAYSITALAVEPFAADDEEKRSIFESFELFRQEHDCPYERDFYNGDYVSKAGIALGNVVHGRRDTPRFVKKTLKWLSEHK